MQSHDIDRDLRVLEDYPMFVAYNANVDAIVRVDEDLERALDPPATDDSHERLDSIAELSAVLAETMESGHGNEYPMSDELAAQLLEVIEPDQQGLGGQAGLMSNALSILGAEPVFWTYMLSDRQRATFDRPEWVRYPVKDGDDVALVPLTEAPVADQTKVNFIFEFNEGTRFHGATATDDTRLIAAMRPERFNLDIGDLDEVVDRLGERVECASLSGYHSLKRAYEDGSGFEEGIQRGKRTLRRLRADHDITVQMEYGVTHYDELRRLIREEIVPLTDLVGTDGRELDVLVEDLDVTPETSATTGGPEPADVSPAVARYHELSGVLEELDVSAVRLHATDYFITVFDDYLPPAAVRRGFEFAAVVAAAKASQSRLREADRVRAGLEFPPSEDGLAAVAALADEVGAEPDESGSLTTDHVVAVPNRVVPNPQGTVGIGDVVAASCFAVENALVDAGELDDTGTTAEANGH
jgi:ADP-dependent phosphofructokinase/glucokinase